MFWIIIEILRNTESYKLPLEKNTYRSIKIQSNTNINIEEYIRDCINEYKETENGNGLFNTDGKYFWSESLLKRMTKMEEVSAKRKKAGQRGAQGRWRKTEVNNSKKIAKNNKCITNAITYYDKCYKNYGKSIAKNSKIKSKSKIKIKIKIKSKSKIKIKIKDIKSIYPSNHKPEKENKTLTNMMDETEKMEFERLINNCEMYIFSPELAIELTEILKEMYMHPDTRERIQEINSKKLSYALKNFAIANTRSQIKIPKAYFKKCILSALDQTELSTQYDTDTIYEMGDY